MTDPIRAALERLQEYATAHPEHDTDRLLAAALAALAAEPPALTSREALAARPLLEQLARIGDRIGPFTVGETMAISERAAAWLAENPPGQPVAIEPRGCPAPGACSCVEPSAPDPDPSDFQTLQGIALDMVESLRPIVIPEILGTLRRAIREPAACPHIRSNGDSNWCALAEQQAAPEPNQAPAGDHIPAATKMVADGEREELAQWLYRLADERSRNRRLGAQPSLLTRAAALLRQPAPEGLVVQEYVHLDSGARIIRDPSEEQSGGCWVVRNSRHVSPIADFSTVAAALAALEPPQGGEVAP
jgi:hypothetical protein